MKYIKLFEQFTPGGEFIGGIRQPINPDAIVWSKEPQYWDAEEIKFGGYGDFAMFNPETGEIRWQFQGEPIDVGFKRMKLDDVPFENLYLWADGDALFVFNTPPINIEQ